MRNGPVILSLAIITVGVGWLLTALGFGPQINWVWTLGLGLIGILTFVVCQGVDKLSVVVGPFFLISSLLSLLRQTGRLTENVEVPLLMILSGVLLLLAQSPLIPLPGWYSPAVQSKVDR